MTIGNNKTFLNISEGEPLKIVDAHQHFWDFQATPKDFAWMSEEMEVLKQRFMPIDLTSLRILADVEGSIAIQARELKEETDFLLELADSDSSILGVVGWADLCSVEIDAILEQYAKYSKLKGFRMLIHDRIDPDFADSMGHMQGVSCLEQHGYTYDLLLRTIHLQSATRLVDRLPYLHFVVDHIAKPKLDGSDIDAWKSGIQAIANRPNVMCKLSGLVTESVGTGWHEHSFHPYLNFILDVFGPDRLMIGSDWPVCTLAADYTSTLNIVKNWADDLSNDEKTAIFRRNCLRFYKI